MPDDRRVVRHKKMRCEEQGMSMPLTVNGLMTMLAVSAWILSAVILMWSVLASLLTQRSLELTQRMISGWQDHYRSFHEHVAKTAEFLSADKVGTPSEVTIVTSTLLYGIEARKEHDGQDKGQHDPAAGVFLDLLEGWIQRWELQGDDERSPTPLLRLCLWTQDDHLARFGLPAKQQDWGDFEEKKVEHLQRLRDLLERIHALEKCGRMTVKFHTTRCREVRVFLVKRQELLYHSNLVAVTRLTPQALERARVRYIGFLSRERRGYHEYHAFAMECCYLGDEDHGYVEPQKDPLAFIEQWFGVDLKALEGEATPPDPATIGGAAKQANP